MPGWRHFQAAAPGDTVGTISPGKRRFRPCRAGSSPATGRTLGNDRIGEILAVPR